MKYNITFLFLFLLGWAKVYSQTTCASATYVPKPSQDCKGAIALCQLSTTYPTGSICGPGAIPGEISTGSCLSSNERNTTWYVFKVSQSGKLKFKIKPLDVTATSNGDTDYDWAVFKLPAGQQNTASICAQIKNNLSWQFSCNYSSQDGETGMYETSTTQQVDVQGAGGSRFNRTKTVNVGEYYVLAVDNFTGGTELANLMGYTITFADPSDPLHADAADIVPGEDTISISAITQTPTCVNNSVVFSFDSPVRCDSVKASKFEIKGANPPYTILSVTPFSAADCSDDGQSQTYKLTFTPAFVDSTYQLFIRKTIKDICENNVRLDSLPFTIKPFLGTTVYLSGDSAVCPNTVVTLRADTTLSGTYTYIWKKDDVVIPGATTSSYSFIPTSTTYSQYKVIASLLGGCKDSSSVPVRLADLPLLTMPANDTVCYGGKNVKKLLEPVITATPGETLKYKWTSRNNRTKTLSTAPTFEASLDTTDIYTLTITNSRDCQVKASTTIFVGDSIAPKFTVDTLYGAAPLTVHYTNTSEGQRVKYSWNFGDPTTPPTEFTITKDSVHIYSTPSLADTTYYFTTLSVMDTTTAIAKKLSLNGCVKTYTQVIKVVPFIIPNIITPNGDYKNDGFRFSGWSTELTLKVYNRWGNLVYESSSYRNDWDASQLPQGTYFYYLEDKQLNRTAKGWVDVLKN
ncbi:gliding motility-associated C-terminal domain-containing protein [Flexibacter flexilis DSM 6793]|uniref:Gliding motility-associated C-terminal domain-containing protein n=1 Tax=Flexibacter flexilis DSM 6793 TaxID=927664 RepID=A0A1I1K3E5_9BACT|nr:gliding motility-associated C-terminal domain-containing protein [Flexibacter flexilis]SFC52100.1 gliding motility-associated C-terminal domain-containing protein [Flexibacter flexilis DSM 6793]